MRLTIGAKLNSLIVSTLVVSVCGTMWLGTKLFSSDLERMVHKGALDRATVLAGRVRNEMSSAARLAAVLGNASLLDFRFDEDRIRFIESGLGSDPTLLGVSLYEKSFGGKRGGQYSFRPVWRAAAPAHDPSVARLTRADLEALDREYPLRLGRAERGDIDFRVARLRDGSPSLRMALPFVERQPGSSRSSSWSSFRASGSIRSSRSPPSSLRTFWMATASCSARPIPRAFRLATI